MTRAIVSTLAATGLALALSGCLEVKTTTRVKPDGSLTRTVEVSGDSMEIPRAIALFGLDSTWTFPADSSNKKGKVTAVREFAGAEEANAVLKGVTGKKLDIRISVEKRFRWFVTTYRYEETWPKLNAFDKIPLSSYLSKEELERIQTGKFDLDSNATGGDTLHWKEVEVRFIDWIQRNRFEEYYGAFVTGVQRLNDPRFTADSVIASKERVFAQVREAFGLEVVDDAMMLQKLRQAFRTPAVDAAFALCSAERAQYREKLDFAEDAKKPTYSVSAVLPGLVSATNARSLEGNRLTWSDFILRTYFGEVAMWGESSMVNWWAIIVTALLIIGIVVGLAAGLVRKRK